MKSRRFATIVLAGGKGTRMGSSDKHKVCFEVLGVPVIIRALETYNLCGSALNIVVVGMMAESVMSTVNQRFPGTAYAFQDRQLGTGDAARRGAELLERSGFDGDVLVVAGDKVIDPGTLRQFLSAHERTGADVTVATLKRPAKSSAGILLRNGRGNIIGILEEDERQRLEALHHVAKAFAKAPTLAAGEVDAILAEHCSERVKRHLESEIWGEGSAGLLVRADFERRFGVEERRGEVVAAGERLPVEGILERCDQQNLSTYLFRGPVLHEALGRLRSNRPNQEEYLTDVIGILVGRRKKVAGFEIQDARDLMAFNNPQELLAIEEEYRRRQGAGVREAETDGERSLAAPESWANLFERPSASAHRRFRQWYGPEVPWENFREAIASFQQRFGTGGEVSIIRSPGRINLLGRHIDHQGGTVNVMAVNREILLVASPRKDDLVRLANRDDEHFKEQTFRISDLVASVNWDDWQRLVDGPRLQRMLDAARGDWGNYAKAAILRLQELFRDRRLSGLDMMVSGDIPMGAGLSSSSALVVAVADAVVRFNRLPVSARRLVSLCGEGEWFVGTRGGAADHAAIKLSRRGCVTRVGFFPFRIEDSAPFFSDHDLVVCNSGIYAGKSNQARNTFNAKVTAYHIGRVWFKLLRPELAQGIQHLRDVTAENLGLSHREYVALLAQLPARITRAQVQAAFAQIADAERASLERMFLSHDAPAAGYAVRDVVLFGLSEMARARRCLEWLKKGDPDELGRLMRISHDGDRVSVANGRGKWARASMGMSDADYERWAAEGQDGDLALRPGSYGCSLPEIDRIVDLASRQRGVKGAQMAGAGLGGCVMVLVQRPHGGELVETLRQEGIKAEVFHPIAGACSLELV